MSGRALTIDASEFNSRIACRYLLLAHSEPLHATTPLQLQPSDASYTATLPKPLVAMGGLDAITHALESYVSCSANEFTQPHSLRAVS